MLPRDWPSVAPHRKAMLDRCPCCRQSVPTLLNRLLLAHGAMRVECTPRRLAVVVEGVAPRQEDVAEDVRGPPAKAREGACFGSCVLLSGTVQDGYLTCLCRYSLPELQTWVFNEFTLGVWCIYCALM